MLYTGVFFVELYDNFFYTKQRISFKRSDSMDCPLHCNCRKCKVIIPPDGGGGWTRWNNMAI